MKTRHTLAALCLAGTALQPFSVASASDKCATEEHVAKMCPPSPSRNPIDRKIAEFAVRIALARHQEEGMAGLVADSEDCQKLVTDKLLCLYLDYASAAIDHAGHETFKFPRMPYFSPAQIAKREDSAVSAPLGRSIYSMVQKEFLKQAGAAATTK